MKIESAPPIKPGGGYHEEKKAGTLLKGVPAPGSPMRAKDKPVALLALESMDQLRRGLLHAYHQGESVEAIAERTKREPRQVHRLLSEAHEAFHAALR